MYLAYGTDTGMEFAVKQVLLRSESGEDNLKVPMSRVSRVLGAAVFPSVACHFAHARHIFPDNCIPGGASARTGNQVAEKSPA